MRESTGTHHVKVAPAGTMSTTLTLIAYIMPHYRFVQLLKICVGRPGYEAIVIASLGMMLY